MPRRKSQATASASMRFPAQQSYAERVSPPSPSATFSKQSARRGLRETDNQIIIDRIDSLEWMLTQTHILLRFMNLAQLQALWRCSKALRAAVLPVLEANYVYRSLTARHVSPKRVAYAEVPQHISASVEHISLWLYTAPESGKTTKARQRITPKAGHGTGPHVCEPVRFAALPIRKFHNVTHHGAGTPCLQFLSIRGFFKEPFCHFAESITTLVLDVAYNQPIVHLPAGLRELSLLGRFNHPLDRLPQGLVYLKLGDHFCRDLHNLPASLRILVIGNAFDHELVHLPENLARLQLGDRASVHPLDKLPRHLTHLKLGRNWHKPLDKLPLSLTHLSTGDVFDQSLEDLPDNLEHLILGVYYNQKLPERFPSALKTLRFGVNFDQPLDNLPESLEALELGYAFMQTSSKPLPTGLKRLILHSCRPFVYFDLVARGRIPPQCSVVGHVAKTRPQRNIFYSPLIERLYSLADESRSWFQPSRGIETNQSQHLIV